MKRSYYKRFWKVALEVQYAVGESLDGALQIRRTTHSYNVIASSRKMAEALVQGDVPDGVQVIQCVGRKSSFKAFMGVIDYQELVPDP